MLELFSGSEIGRHEIVKAKLICPIFWALVGFFFVILGQFFIPVFRDLLRGSLLFLSPFAVFFLLGVALVILTVKEKVGGMLKKFLLLTGASAAGFLVSVFLHNAIYGLVLVKMLNRPDLDEPVFFFIAILVCPIAFLVGAVGSIVLYIKKFRMARKPSGSQ